MRVRPMGSGQDPGLGGRGWLGTQPHQVLGSPLHQGQAGQHQLPRQVWVNGEDIEYSHDARYLGVQLDRLHIMRLQSSMGKLWGPNQYLTRWAYLCAVWPALTLGHFMWAWKATTSTIRRKLARLQADDVEPDLCERRVPKRKF